MPCNVFYVNSINIYMKPLLITFFAAILCYSLFIERRETRETPIHIDDINLTIQGGSFDTLQISEPAVLYTENMHDYYVVFSE